MEGPRIKVEAVREGRVEVKEEKSSADSGLRGMRPLVPSLRSPHKLMEIYLNPIFLKLSRFFSPLTPTEVWSRGSLDVPGVLACSRLSIDIRFGFGFGMVPQAQAQE
jgi:hypothetical protein